MHDVAPTASVNLPGSHSPHSVAAKGRLADFPGTHAVQLPLKLGLAHPAPHAWQLTCPSPSKPGSQPHRSAPASDAACGTSQTKHAVAPEAFANVPGAHREQRAEAVVLAAPWAPCTEPWQVPALSGDPGAQ